MVNHIQQALELRQSWRHAQSPDTDLVVMGRAEFLARLPADMPKVALRPTADSSDSCLGAIPRPWRAPMLSDLVKFYSNVLT